MKSCLNLGTAADDTIDRVLYQLRAEIIRDGRDGKRHVDALLRLRGLDPDAYRVPDKLERVFQGRGARQRAVIAILQASGPATLRALCERVAAANPGTDAKAIYHSIAVCLGNLKRRQAVVHEGRLWRLAR